MSKYIIEIKPEYEDSFKGLMILGAKDSNLFVDTLAVEDMEELNSDYINEHFGILQDDAYKRGLEDGKHTAVGAAELREKLEYQRGLDDTWEAARKIIRMSDGDILDLFPDCYASVCTALQVLLKYDASEAIEKLKAYEEKQKADDKIEVGDEVTHKSSPEKCGIVTKELENVYYMMWADGSCGVWDKEKIVKTGRHFDIDKILAEMRT